MDRSGTATFPSPPSDRPGPGGGTALPSRRGALDRLRDALESGAGSLLLTGGAGAGKSWILARLRDEMPTPWRFAEVDLSPAVGPVELYRLVHHELGLDGGGSLARLRTSLAGFLADRAEDGERWVLAVEEGHAAPFEALEELRVLTHHAGRASRAFSGLILVGQTALLRRLSARTLAPLAARLAERVHLHPISVDELQIWIARDQPGISLDPADVERLHRDAAGNPRQLLQRLGRLIPHAPKPRLLASRTLPEPRSETTGVEPGEAGLPWVAPVVASVKPPLEVGDGMIEVGWESNPAPDGDDGPGDETPDSATPETDARDRAGSDPPKAAGGSTAAVLVDDHYAALQAWTEWARNQGRAPVPSGLEVAGQAAPADTPGADDSAEPPGWETFPAQAGVRAEGQQGFAPYSQLFTRLRKSRDTL